MPGKRLSSEERAQIEALYGEGLPIPKIAARIRRDRSTVWRELVRNNSHRGGGISDGVQHPRRGGRWVPGRGYVPGWGRAYRYRYSHARAQQKADRRARRPRAFKLHRCRTRPPSHPLLAQLVDAKLNLKWSPVEISQWLRKQYPDQSEWWVSAETIYQAVFYQARGEMRGEVDRQQRLRSGRQSRRPQSRVAAAARSRRPWVEGFNISTRPAEAADRAVPGHWEGDLIIGARGSSAIITLVERSSRFVMLGALPDSRVSDEVISVLIKLMGRVPEELRRTLTWDQGAEMAQHATFTLATDCQVYFCDPHSPWQRGSNENTNGLLRQYFPRSSTNFRTYTQDDLDAIARELNGRPRQTLDWDNPAEALNRFLVATAT